MGEFNLFDGLVAVIILLSAYFAYLRGAVREIMAVANWILAALAAYLLAPQAIPLVDSLPILGEYLSGSCELSIIVAFTLVFAAALIVCSTLTAALVRLASIPAVGVFDHGLGLVFGALRGILIVAVILILHEAVFAGSQVLKSVSESGSATVFHDLQVRIQAQLPSNAASRLAVIYNNVTAICAAEALPAPEIPSDPPLPETDAPAADPPA